MSLRFLLEKDLINLKHLFWSSSVATIFVCLDIFFQFYNGKDIFGFPSRGRKMGGPFGDELIAGGFIQRFSLFSFFLVPLFYSNTKKGNIFNKIKIKRYLDFKPSLKDDSADAQMGKDDIGYYSTVSCPDVWPIKGVFNMSQEYIDFNTQKPEILLHRIITVSSLPKSLILDYFSGSGTTIATSHKMGRK